jgi:two-component system phosphate regulon response regulator PhoB
MSGKPLILVVDDDGPILLLMRNLLREFGFEPAVASSGREAVTSARTRTPDLILLDKNMPGMSGDDVMRELRGDRGLSDVPVLMLSGEPIEPSELAQLGANGAVLKPFDVPALIETIRAHVGARA